MSIAPVPAQDEPRLPFQELTALLGTPSFTADVHDTLVRAGSRAVPALTAVLKDYEDELPSRITGALFVLGQMQGTAEPALEQILETYAYGLQPEVRRQALWAIGQVTPRIQKNARAACRRALTTVQQEVATDADLFLLEIVKHRLRLGPNPTLLQMSRSLGLHRTAVIAGCWALSTSEASGEDLDDVLADVESILGDELEQNMQPWLVYGELSAAVPDLASVLWQRNRRSELSARGILRHWDARLREQAIAMLAKQPDVSAQARFDMTSTLNDTAANVRGRALAAAIDFGPRGALFLPALQLHARDATAPWSGKCAQAAKQILAAIDHTPTREAITALCRIAAGATDDTNAAISAETDTRVLAEFVTGCRGRPDVDLRRIAALCRRAKMVDEPIVEAFAWCLGAADRTTWSSAALAFTELGRDVTLYHPDVTTLLMRSSRTCRAHLRHIPTYDAWIRAGESASRQDLLASCRDGYWYVVRRSLCELANRGTRLGGAEQQQLLRILKRRFHAVEIDEGGRLIVNGWERYTREMTVDVDFQSLYAAACLALLAGGGDTWTEPDLLTACAAEFDVPVDDVEPFLRAKAKAGELGELTRIVEAEMLLEAIAATRRR